MREGTALPAWLNMPGIRGITHEQWGAAPGARLAGDDLPNMTYAVTRKWYVTQRGVAYVVVSGWMRTRRGQTNSKFKARA